MKPLTATCWFLLGCVLLLGTPVSTEAGVVRCTNDTGRVRIRISAQIDMSCQAYGGSLYDWAYYQSGWVRTSGVYAVSWDFPTQDVAWLGAFYASMTFCGQEIRVGVGPVGNGIDVNYDAGTNYTGSVVQQGECPECEEGAVEVLEWGTTIRQTLEPKVWRECVDGHWVNRTNSCEAVDWVECPTNCPACAIACAPGDVVSEVHSVHTTIQLGQANFGQSAGSVQIAAERPSFALARSSSLTSQLGSGVDGVLDNGVLRQVRTPQALAEVAPLDDFGYEVRVFDNTAVGPKVGGYYQTNGIPCTTIRVENPDASTNVCNRLRITRTTHGITTVDEYIWTEALQQWELTTGNGLRRESRAAAWETPGLLRADTIIVRNPDGQVISKQTERWQVFPWGTNLVERVVDPDGAALTTRWSYYDDVAANHPSYARLKMRVEPSGYWERFEYASNGLLAKTVAQFLNAPTNAPENLCRVITASLSQTAPHMTTVETLQGQEIARRYRFEKIHETRDIRCVEPGAVWTNAANLVTITRPIPKSGFVDSRNPYPVIHDWSIQRPDGTLTLSYTTAAADGRTETITNETGAADGSLSAVTNGTRSICMVDQVGHVLSERVYDIGSSALLAQTVTTQTDEFGRATSEVSLVGTNQTVFGCCGVSQITDAEGVTTRYTHDALKRVLTTERAGIIVSNVYDAADQVRATFRNGTLLGTSEYDLAGRLIRSTDALSNATMFATVRNQDGETVQTITYPDGSTHSETDYQDGQLKSVTGTAVPGIRYEYGVENNQVFTREIRLATDGTDTSEWRTTFTDMLGRPVRTEYADGAVTLAFYNAQGQLWKEVDQDGVVTLCEYNERGERTVTAVDVDRNDQIDRNGADRIGRTEMTVTTAHGQPVERMIAMSWDTANAWITNLVSDVSLEGRQYWSITSGLTNHTRIASDAATARRTVTEESPDGAQSVLQYENGRPVALARYDALGQQTTGRVFTYDTLGRLQETSDSRLGTATVEYDAADQRIATSVTPLDPREPAHTTRVLYDAMGRQQQVTLPDGGVVHYEYHPTGALRRRSGARTYPVEYSYDHAGRLKTLTTWQNHANDAGRATTTWNYDPQRGWLVAKANADGRGPGYSYSAAGRLRSRTSARGVTTTYEYNAAGELENVVYSDATPAISHVYDRTGRPSTIASTAAEIQYGYGATGQILAEYQRAGPLAGLVLTNAYDSLLRRTSLAVVRGGSPLSAIGYQYDTASRLRSVGDGTHLARYAWLANRTLISNTVLETSGTPVFTTSRAYDSRDRLANLTTLNSQQAMLDSFAYRHNLASQRSQVTLADNTYWVYGYDALGQVTSGKRFLVDGTPVAGQQFEYTFDDIGNRTAQAVNGRTAVYTPNQLNQYGQRTVPGMIDVVGLAATNATVTVSGQPATRQSSWFHAGVAVANGAAPIDTNLQVVAVINDWGTNGEDLVAEQGGRRFLPRTPETFTYDADGNLTTDGRWNYTWDAENRLVAMETRLLGGGTPATPFRQRLEFAYDPVGRRIEKKVYDWATDHWSLVTDHLFTYDGWNLVAEFDALHAPDTPTLLRSYVWGTDLSGSEQGAGGTGGLLLMTDHSSARTYHFTYDGGGNVTALGDASTGAIVARYEYGPFGETLRATGPMARANPFRFATKYQDQETGLIYFGYRYYSPELGRWLSRDRIDEVGGQNVYEFSSNYTSGFVDPIGLAGYFFDGTGNHPNARNWDGSPNYKTNVRMLYDAYSYNNGEAFYAFGMGTGYTASGLPYPAEGRTERIRAESATGDTMSMRVDWMLRQLEAQMKAGDFTVDLFGFSRGGASALLFLNRIAKKVHECDPLYSKLQIRFVGLFDAVDSFRSLPGLVSGDMESGRMAEFSFGLPGNLNYLNQPVHFIALDEQREQFQSMDVVGAYQIGFRGVHSDDGGGYGPANDFSWLTLREMTLRGDNAGLQFDRDSLIQNTRSHGENLFTRQVNPTAEPTDNSAWYYNDGEQRNFPPDMKLHISVWDFNSKPKNNVGGF